MPYDNGSQGGALGGAEIREVRMAWKPPTPPNAYQVADTDDIPKVISYTDLTDASASFSVDLALGEITVLDAMQSIEFLADFQVVRQSGGGVNEWGFFLQTDTGGGWVDIPDSLRVKGFDSGDDNAKKQISYAVGGGTVAAGTKFRVMQVTDDVSDGLGIITSTPFTNAPRSAGAIISFIGVLQ